jgi:hypothetical protein
MVKIGIPSFGAWWPSSDRDASWVLVPGIRGGGMLVQGYPVPPSALVLAASLGLRCPSTGPVVGPSQPAQGAKQTREDRLGDSG